MYERMSMMYDFMSMKEQLNNIRGEDTLVMVLGIGWLSIREVGDPVSVG
jgi:hypothetical protein